MSRVGTQFQCKVTGFMVPSCCVRPVASPKKYKKAARLSSASVMKHIKPKWCIFARGVVLIPVIICIIANTVAVL